MKFPLLFVFLFFLKAPHANAEINIDTLENLRCSEEGAQGALTRPPRTTEDGKVIPEPCFLAMQMAWDWPITRVCRGFTNVRNERGGIKFTDVLLISIQGKGTIVYTGETNYIIGKRTKSYSGETTFTKEGAPRFAASPIVLGELLSPDGNKANTSEYGITTNTTDGTDPHSAKTLKVSEVFSINPNSPLPDVVSTTVSIPGSRNGDPVWAINFKAAASVNSAPEEHTQ